MTLKSNFGNRKKLGPTRKPTQMLGLKFGMQGLRGSRVWTNVLKGVPSSAFPFTLRKRQ